MGNHMTSTNMSAEPIIDVIFELFLLKVPYCYSCLQFLMLYTLLQGVLHVAGIIVERCLGLCLLPTIVIKIYESDNKIFLTASSIISNFKMPLRD